MISESAENTVVLMADPLTFQILFIISIPFSKLTLKA